MSTDRRFVCYRLDGDSQGSDISPCGCVYVSRNFRCRPILRVQVSHDVHVRRVFADGVHVRRPERHERQALPSGGEYQPVAVSLCVLFRLLPPKVESY